MFCSLSCQRRRQTAHKPFMQPSCYQPRPGYEYPTRSGSSRDNLRSHSHIPETSAEPSAGCRWLAPDPAACRCAVLCEVVAACGAPSLSVRTAHSDIALDESSAPRRADRPPIQLEDLLAPWPLARATRQQTTDAACASLPYARCSPPLAKPPNILVEKWSSPPSQSSSRRFSS
ncbi:hypothetical protein CALVIDRAFT_404163 [Calocera viscosa TUFC12733]|uniref:Uncharacterized protein n=1 Tax=Calocera viscosa (strain TUFC12733) TaxID=1330018 RepID=A0A167PVG7_CALVF|nr:hypothetical protein CALVIDRAFT_404163 [Calocera viscosa TUFC12733]